MTDISDIVEELKRLNLRQKYLVEKLEHATKTGKHEQATRESSPYKPAQRQTTFFDRDRKPLKVGDKVIVLTRGVSLQRNSRAHVIDFTATRVRIKRGQTVTDRAPQNLRKV